MIALLHHSIQLHFPPTGSVGKVRYARQGVGCAKAEFCVSTLYCALKFPTTPLNLTDVGG
jgi:hypothetical protein